MNYTVNFQYAARQGIDLASSQAIVYWNGRQVATVTPTDYLIRNFTTTVESIPRTPNTLTIAAAGPSDGFGLGIDNVGLFRYGSSGNIASNGGFELPSIGNGLGFYPGISGWISKEIELGYGPIYNANWNSQIVELDGYQNNFVTQVFNL